MLRLGKRHIMTSLLYRCVYSEKLLRTGKSVYVIALQVFGLPNSLLRTGPALSGMSEKCVKYSKSPNYALSRPVLLNCSNGFVGMLAIFCFDCKMHVGILEIVAGAKCG